MNKTCYILILLVILAAFSCTSTKEHSQDTYSFKGYSEINQGDTANISWNIPQSDSIVIAGVNGVFRPMDSTKLAPNESSVFNFKVITGLDTTNLVWEVKVNQLTSEIIKTGPDSDFKGEWLPSYTESGYLIGRLGKSVSANPRKLKVMRINNLIKDKGELEVRFTLIDDFGNFIPAYFDKSNNGIVINSTCGNESLMYSSMSVNEIDNLNQDYKITLNIENSYASGEFDPIDNYLHSFVNSFSESDMIKLNYFNQNNEVIFDYTDSKKATEYLNLRNIPLPQGLNGLYKNTYFQLRELKGDNNIFIIINYSPDNSSITYNANDLVKSAIAKNIPVYIISLGYAINTYNLKYIADRTGGRYYNIPENEINKLDNILKEIYYSHKSYYSIKLLINQSDVNNCHEMKNNLYIENDEHLHNDFSVQFRDKAQYSDYQALSAFEYRQTQISSQFTENITNLANTLKQNPNMTIELIGHSSIEGSEQYNSEISLKRAQEVRKSLLFHGAKSEQIRVRAEGSSLPIYFLQQKPWQQYYNRRVELKWLEPSLLPYEIIDNIYETETNALERVEEWERNGYMAYYDRFLINNNPHYRVKIWGYPTLEDAAETASKLEDEYKKEFKVQ